MKVFTLILIAVIGFQAEAKVTAHPVTTHKEFTIWSSTINGSIYYNCDSVEDAVTELLTQLGAKNISVRCTGGLDDFMPPMDAYVDVSFTALKLGSGSHAVSADWKSLQLHSWDDCHLKSEILKNTMSGFSIKNLQVSSCSFSSSPFRASLTTLFKH